MAQYKLMAHQTDGVKFLDDMDGIGALLFDPGVGKTGTTLAWIDKQAHALATSATPREFKVLVVAPLAATDTWVLQAPPFMDATVKARFFQGSTKNILAKIRVAGSWRMVPEADIKVDHRGSGAKATIVSISAGAVSSWCTDRTKTVQMLQAIRKFKPDLVVVDESHIIKSATANISKAMYQIGQLAPHRIILTGTVNPKDALDCYGQWRFLAPWTFSDSYNESFTKKPLEMTRAQAMSVRPWAWGRFRDRYADLTVVRGAGGKAKMIAPGVALTTIVGVNEDTVPELHDRVAERSMVVRKEDALDLPPITNIHVPVHLTSAEKAAYLQMHDELAAELDSGEVIEAVNALAKRMKLRQIAAGFVKDSDTGEVHIVGSSLIDTVCGVVNNQLVSEDRVVVFAYFRSEVAAIAAKLAQKGRIVEVVNGQTKASERLAIRQRFGDVSRNPTPTVLVAQVKTMSLSVNELVTASHAVFASPPDQRDTWVQAHDRLDRKGQTKPVTFWHCYTSGLVGEVIIETHKHRGNMEKAMLDHIRAKPRL